MGLLAGDRKVSLVCQKGQANADSTLTSTQTPPGVLVAHELSLRPTPLIHHEAQATRSQSGAVLDVQPLWPGTDRALHGGAEVVCGAGRVRRVECG